jgi:hypothetical protein
MSLTSMIGWNEIVGKFKYFICTFFLKRKIACYTSVYRLDVRMGIFPTRIRGKLRSSLQYQTPLLKLQQRLFWQKLIFILLILVIPISTAVVLYTSSLRNKKQNICTVIDIVIVLNSMVSLAVCFGLCKDAEKTREQILNHSHNVSYV